MRLRGAVVNGLLLLLSACLTVSLIEAAARLSGRYVDEDTRRIRTKERLYSLKDPLLGWRGMPHASYELVGTGAKTTVRNNSLGFRDREFMKARTPGVTRIAVLGDSFIWGYGTELASRRFTDLLEARLRKAGLAVEVYNFGISGWGTDQEYLAYQSIVRAYRPDLVILGYFINDPLDNLTRPGKPYYLLVNGTLELRNVPVSRATEATYTPSLGDRVKITLAHRLYTYQLLRDGLKPWDAARRFMIRLGWLPDELRGHDIEAVAAMTRELVIRLRDAVEHDGAKFMVLWIPELLEFRQSRMDFVMRATISIKDRLARSSLGWTALDLTPIFAAAMRGSKALYQEYDGRHWNDDGNRLVAEEVARFLRSEGLPPFARDQAPSAGRPGGSTVAAGAGQ